MTWNTEPMVTSAALIGRPDGSVARRGALAATSCGRNLRDVPVAADVADDRARRSRAGRARGAEIMAPWSTPRRPMAESAAPSLRTLDRGGAGLVGAALQVPVLGLLVVVHERLGPVDGRDADAQEAETRGRGRAARFDRRIDSGVSPGGSAKYATRKPIVREDREGEQEDDLTLGLLVRLRVVVAEAVVVLRVARVLEPLGQRARPRAVTSRRCVASWPGGRGCSRGLRSDPDCCADEQADADDPGPEALADRAEGAEGRGRRATRHPARR